MAEFITGYRGLNATNARVDMLRADFEGLKNLDKIISSVLNRLALQDKVNMQVQMVRSGAMSRANFDGWFAEVVRQELGKVLGVQRAKAVQKARQVGAGSASSAVLRRMYKDELAGNINIASPRGRISSRTRNYQPGWLSFKYGATAKKINEYYGRSVDSSYDSRGWHRCAHRHLTDQRARARWHRGVLADQSARAHSSTAWVPTWSRQPSSSATPSMDM